MDNKKIRPDFSNNKRPVSPTMPTMRVSGHTQNVNAAEGAKPAVAKPATPKVTAQPRPVNETAAQPKNSAPLKPVTTSATSNMTTSSKPITNNLNSKKEKTVHSNKKKLLFSFGLVLLIALIAIIALLIINNTNKSDPEGASDGSSPVFSTTEEEEKITKETLDKYTEITIEGYKEIDNNPVANAAVIVSVKNISNEKVSLAIVMAAMDENDNVLETSSIYAEGIEPGQTHTFETFVYTELTPDQLRNAKYKAYKASTYEAPTPSSDGDVAPAPEETPEAAGEAATE